MNAAQSHSDHYLRQQLARNPWTDVEEILASRARQLGQRVEAGPSLGVGLAEQRCTTREALEAVRQRCLSDDPAEVAAALDALDRERFPELGASIDRLRLVLSARPELDVLLYKSRPLGACTDFFRRLLAASPPVAATLREDCLRSLQGKPDLLRKYLLFRSEVRSESPTLYALERHWFDSLSSVGAGNGINVPFLLGVSFVALMVLLGLLLGSPKSAEQERREKSLQVRQPSSDLRWDAGAALNYRSDSNLRELADGSHAVESADGVFRYGEDGITYYRGYRLSDDTPPEMLAPEPRLTAVAEQASDAEAAPAKPPAGSGAFNRLLEVTPRPSGLEQPSTPRERGGR